MVVDGNGQNSFGAFLTDHVLIQDALDLGRFGDGFGAPAFVFFGDLVEELKRVADALLTDVYPLSADEAQAFTLALATKDTVEKLFGVAGRGQGGHFFLTIT